MRVVRFWNHDVLARTSAVLEAIAGELAQPLEGVAGDYQGGPACFSAR